MKVFVVFFVEDNKPPRIDRIFLTETVAKLHILRNLNSKSYIEPYELKKIPKEHDKLHF